jgi:C4-type Zn-finger protein
MIKTIKCPVCFYHSALLENDYAEPGSPEYLNSVFCPACELDTNDLDYLETKPE